MKLLHVELSTRCQAMCPMCPRNHSGGPARSFIGPNDMRLAEFKAWFPPEWLRDLDTLLVCGNYGDPIMNHDTLDILTYVRQANANCRISFHTNGSARNSTWWRLLGNCIGQRGSVHMAVDGTAVTHHLYRAGTDWQHIMMAAAAVMEGGAEVCAETLVFAHNQHEIIQLQQDLLSRGFAKVTAKHTQRFGGASEFISANGVRLAPAGSQKIKPYPGDDQVRQWLKTVSINPACRREGESIYVDVHGQVWPCCHIAESWTTSTDPDRHKSAVAEWNEFLFADTVSFVEQTGVISLDYRGIEYAMSLARPAWLVWENSWKSQQKPCNCAVFCRGT